LAETANISVELDTALNGRFQDGYESYPCIYAGENNAESSKKWSGDWDKYTTSLGISKPRWEQLSRTDFRLIAECNDTRTKRGMLFRAMKKDRLSKGCCERERAQEVCLDKGEITPNKT